MRCVLLSIFAFGALAFAVAPRVALGQEITVSGTVVERAWGSWVGGATVRLSGSSPYFTDIDGQFRFSGVTPGRHTLTVEGMGYRVHSLELDLRADTTLLIELDPDPVLLDSLLVRPGNITIQGDIYDASTGDKVLFAQVRLVPGIRVVEAVSGGFAIKDVPIGRAVTLVVESVGFEPAPIALITEADTTLRVELEHDSVAIRMLAHEVEKLEFRSQGVPFPRRVTSHTELNRFSGWPVFEVVEAELAQWGRNAPDLRGGAPTKCLFIDDRRVIGYSLLWSLSAGEVERIEIYDRGYMIRVYTKRFVMGMMGREPGPIVYMRIGLGGRVCR